ncbi:MAG: DNA polymerase III subunit gamma/tau [Burkholderiales bacterium]|nr:DNA polymerase III subunit gamma/tau [Burkholderiales bacterium]
MKHTVLARKWRPKKFKDLVGQDNSVRILTNILNSDRIHHAILLTGTRGVGKTTIARIIAKGLNCLTSVDGEPCANCENCSQIDAGSFIDVIEIDAASNTGVDNIRELIDNAQYAPTSGKYKVYIIDEVHMLSKSAFNAMLKTLEEPPANVVFILATTELQKVPATILSRCLQLKLRNLLAAEIHNYLITILELEHIQFETPALELIAHAALGSMRDALSLLDQAIAFSNSIITEVNVQQMLGISSDDVIYALLNALCSLNGATLMHEIKQIYASGIDLEVVLSKLQQKLCELSITQLIPDNANTKLTPFIDKISVNDVHLYFEIANLGLEQLKKTNDKYPIFTMTLLRMLAFNIGTDQNKTITFTQSNFKVNPAEISPTNQNSHVQPDQSAVAVTTPKLNKELLPESLNKNTSAAHAPAEELPQEELISDAFGNYQNFAPEKPKLLTSNDQPLTNWFELITELKPQLGALYPFLENAQLQLATDDTLNIIIDSRYESAFTKNMVSDLTQILSNYFTREITLNISFNQCVTHTLKEKNLQEKEDKQRYAEQSIAEDEYLIKFLNRFSAKIMPGSIKPL